jgi:hypothetical protein
MQQHDGWHEQRSLWSEIVWAQLEESWLSGIGEFKRPGKVEAAVVIIEEDSS